MTQLPFHSSNTSADFPLQIVYSDVWGPAPITSVNDFRYYVSFIDSYSSFTWFFPLKHKSQVFSSFIHFKNTMENLLGTSIKIFRTDYGGEYSKNEFQSFCSSHGIRHQFTCPHTSQQNGVFERKHRHIVDMALSLISHSSLPFTYWPYAFSTTVFLINRLPSVIRNYVSPWHLLFGNNPNYKSFKTFGCACYPLLRPYSSHKFSLRSTQCVFPGYATNAKGYLCLDPISSRLYTSRHVVFDETTFPFSNSSHSTSSPPSSTKSNPWLSNLLFFQACSHTSILGPHPSTHLPSILGPIPTSVTPLAQTHTHNPSFLSHLNAPHITQPTIPEPTLPNTIPEPTHPPTIPEPTNPPTIPELTLPDSIPPSPSFVPPAPSSSYLHPDAHLIPESTNIHPMITRSKDGISKKKVFHVQTTKPKVIIFTLSLLISRLLLRFVNGPKLCNQNLMLYNVNILGP